MTYTAQQKAKAWGVHAFTATGAIWGLFGLIAVIEQAWQIAFVWMLVAIVVDSVDGFFARRASVKEVLPDFDGALLDNIIDYTTYVVIPAVMVYQIGLMPRTMALMAAAIIVFTSSYQFSQGEAKTDDHFFLGFPSYWNVVVYYLFMLDFGPWGAFGVILTCGILVFVPIKFAYPSRMLHYQKPTVVLTAVWGLAIMITILQYPNHSVLLTAGSLLFVVYYVIISFVLDRRLKREHT